MLRLNLLPQQYILMRMRRRATTLIVILFAAVIALIGAAAVLSQRSQRQAEELRVRIADSYQEAASLVERVGQADARMEAAIRSADRHASLLNRLPVTCVLAMVTNALPERASLTAFDMDAGRGGVPGKAGTPEAGAPKAGDRADGRPLVAVSGMAATDVDVANFMAALTRSSQVRKVDLIRSREMFVESHAVREFLVNIELKPNPDAMEAPDGGKAKVASAGGVGPAKAERQGT